MAKSSKVNKFRKRSEKTEAVREDILKIGVKIWPDVTAREIARRLDMTHNNVSYHYGDDLKDAVAEYAVQVGNSRVIAQLIATNHKAVRDMSETERRKHLKAVL